MKTGDPIKFKATVESLGNEWRTHHLHLIDLEKTEDFINNDHKVTLFHGATFEIIGHLKHEGKVIPLNKETVEKLNNDTNKEIKYLLENSTLSNDSQQEHIKEDKLENNTNINQREN